MNGFTGIKDIDILILLNLKDSELDPVCLMNSYLYSLCNSEIFWIKRILKRIEKSLADTLKFHIFITSISINALRIEDMKKYFGFHTAKQLNTYLNFIPDNALYYLYARFETINLDIIFEFNPNELPEYIDPQKMKFYILKEVCKYYFEFRNDDVIRLPRLCIKNSTPGFINKSDDDDLIMDSKTYKSFKNFRLRN